MTYQRVTKEDLISKDYASLKWEDVEREYRKGIPANVAVLRLQNLEKQLDKMEEEQGIMARKGNFNVSDKVLNFQRAYAAELDFVYSQGVMDEISAWQRLTRHGKSSRISETMLIAKYRTIPLERLFDSEHIDAVDRIALAGMLTSEKEYLVPLNFINQRAKKVEERIRQYVDMIANAQELGEQGQAFRNQLETQLSGFKYERDALYELGMQRAMGSDKNI